MLQVNLFRHFKSIQQFIHFKLIFKNLIRNKNVKHKLNFSWVFILVAACGLLELNQPNDAYKTEIRKLNVVHGIERLANR